MRLSREGRVNLCPLALASGPSPSEGGSGSSERDSGPALALPMAGVWGENRDPRLAV
jgi:hypothetical protein